MTRIFVHISHNDDWDNFPHDFKCIPHKGDQVSFSTDGPIYEVDSTLINAFKCQYEVEIFIHQIKP